MGVQKAHIVAVGSSVPAAITLALKYPSLALSISLAAPAPRTETPVLSSVFDELLHVRATWASGEAWDTLIPLPVARDRSYRHGRGWTGTHRRVDVRFSPGLPACNSAARGQGRLRVHGEASVALGPGQLELPCAAIVG